MQKIVLNLALNFTPYYAILVPMKGVDFMPQIKPISELRNYSTLLESVSPGDPIYLTRNGHGAYAIMSIEEADELDRIKAANMIVTDLRRAKARANQEGWISD